MVILLQRLVNTDLFFAFPEIDVCASSPCQNGGNCILSSANTFTCNCLPGYSGPTCSISEEAFPTSLLFLFQLLYVYLRHQDCHHNHTHIYPPVITVKPPSITITKQCKVHHFPNFILTFCCLVKRYYDLRRME